MSTQAETPTNLSLADHIEMLSRMASHPHFVTINKLTVGDVVAALRDRAGLIAALEMIANRANLKPGDDPVRECMHIYAQACVALAACKAEEK